MIIFLLLGIIIFLLLGIILVRINNYFDPEKYNISRSMRPFKKDYKNIFTGKIEGSKARSFLNLDKEDLKERNVNLVLPPNTISISPYFFTGLFENSINEFKSINKFLEKYTIDLSEIESEQFRNTIIEDIEYAIRLLLENKKYEKE